MSVIVQPWRRSATTSMNSSRVIICFDPFSGRCLVASTRLKGLLRFAGASGAQLNLELRRSLSTKFADHLPRFSVIANLERRVADSGAGGPALGPAWGAPRGFRRGGRRPQHAQQARKPPADPVGRQLPGRAGPLPRQPLIGDELAGQAQLGVGGDHQPGPPLRLLGVAHPRGGPAEGLFTEPDGVLAVEPAGVGPPGKVEVHAAGSGPPQPQHLGRARAGRDAFDLHADDGPAHDRARPAGAVAGVAVLLGMKTGPVLHGHGAVLVVVGHVGGGQGGPGGQVSKGELGAVAARAAASAGWAWWWVGVEAAV